MNIQTIYISRYIKLFAGRERHEFIDPSSRKIRQNENGTDKQDREPKGVRQLDDSDKRNRGRFRIGRH